MKQLTDPMHTQQIGQGAAMFDDYEAAKESLAKWKAADPRGTPSEIALRDERLAQAQRDVDAMEGKLRILRGDLGDADQIAASANLPSANSPTPLTTSDVAHCFAGLHWSTEEAWKKPLGDKPKWLRGCIVIPGSRGRSETRWNPVLVGGALVHERHAKVNSIRAKFQTMPKLQPWLETWKSYEADNFDKP